MDEKLSQYFRRNDLSGYSFRERLLIRSADILFCSLIRSFGMTYRPELVGEENLNDVDLDAPAIVAAWHEHIFAGSYALRGRNLVVMVSQSFDGEYIARLVHRLDFGTVRGSSSRGGVTALVSLARAIDDGLSVLLTVDGPRGPANVAKGGICALAQKTGAPIIPVAVEASSFWRVGSWDRMRIPKPFARLRQICGKPIRVGPADDIKIKLAELQAALDELNQAGKSWRESLKSSH